MAKNDKKVTSLEEAQKLIEQNELMKRQACADEVNAVLKKHGYSLDVSKPQVMLVPAKE